MELPRLQPLHEKYHDQGLSIVAIDARRDTERARSFIEAKKLTFTFLENSEGDDEVVQTLFGVRSFPTSFLIDREGRIMYFHEDFEPGDEVRLEEEIKTLL